MRNVTSCLWASKFRRFVTSYYLRLQVKALFLNLTFKDKESVPVDLGAFRQQPLKYPQVACSLEVISSDITIN